MRLYQGDTPLHSIYARRRNWFKEICWELVGVCLFLAAFWAFIILMFAM